MAKFDLKKAILENKATFFSSLTEGQFSWMTQDTGQQIGSEEENTIPVYMFDDKGNFEKVPAFATKIVDKVGAGDSVFIIASLLARVDAPLKVIGFLANLVAAHEVSQLGHQKSLERSDLLKHAKSILK